MKLWSSANVDAFHFANLAQTLGVPAKEKRLTGRATADKDVCLTTSLGGA
jgi:hypothetical protein